MKTALNESFMQAGEKKANDGLQNIVRTNLYPGLRVYRFGSTKRPDLYFTSPWWLGFSPFEALKRYAKTKGISLFSAAEQCLAIDPGHKVNILHETIVYQNLAAWSGTPRTQVSKVDQRYGSRLEPQRNVTQLCIPGLGGTDPRDASRKIWESAFQTPRYLSP
ncbi:MAG TPA: hypothetical protein VG938_02580 [Verrucomicrobiae bacterium]|jgi:hypothetical protein|nr:hypothetical protein [Verrucomicrobiae bacterium]